MRDFGIEHPVRIGLAGPTNLATLLRYARRCGVSASAQGLARQAGLMRHLFAMSAPDALMRALAEARADGRLGDVAPHFFSFGGLAGTARWAEAVAATPHHARSGRGVPGRAARADTLEDTPHSCAASAAMPGGLLPHFMSRKFFLGLSKFG